MIPRGGGAPARSPFVFLLDPPEAELTPARGAGLADVDDAYLEQALAQAWRGVGRTSPNPPVGAVLVKGRKVIGRGFHRRAGAPHAEVEAFKAAGAGKARGATLYVTLEPCNHHGRTPPCTERILDEGVARVVVGCPDPNPRVDGKGIRRLRRAGVEVVVRRKGPLADACHALIAPFRHRLHHGRPWVVAKVAATLDGRIAVMSGDARWVTGPASRRLVHELRDRVDAVLVGSGTARRDDPALTVRHKPKGRAARNPRRVLVDGQLTLPPTATMLQPDPRRGAPVPLVLHTASAPEKKARQLDRLGIERVAFASSRVPLDEGLAALAERDVDSVLVEPGPGLLTALLEADLIDELWWFAAPALVGADGVAALGPRGLERMEDADRFSRWRGPMALGDDSLVVLGPQERAGR